MSSRSIEGENPLYLPQAKVYLGCAAVGPCILVQQNPLPDAHKITLKISRAGNLAFAGETTLAQLMRQPQELADWLFRANSFPIGCLMMTGTGVVPDDFTLAKGDHVRIEIERIGVLENEIGEI